MSTMLVLNSSALGAVSASRQLVRRTVDAMRAKDPFLRVIERDLGANPVPHLDLDAATAIRGGAPANAAQAAAQALSDELVAELEAADTVIIGAPMYNFGIPSTLKSWFDHVLRAGVTFRYTASGSEGLVKGKRAMVILTRGGFYGGGAARAMDSQEPHLRTLLNFIGIEDVTFVRAEKLAFGPEARDAALTAAAGELDRLVDGSVQVAA